MTDRALRKRADATVVRSENELASRKEVAGYIAELSGDLAVLARRHGHETLAYLLDIARLEAENVSRMARAE
jgi:hypothetical protein